MKVVPLVVLVSILAAIAYALSNATSDRKPLQLGNLGGNATVTEEQIVDARNEQARKEQFDWWTGENAKPGHLVTKAEEAKTTLPRAVQLAIKKSSLSNADEQIKLKRALEKLNRGEEVLASHYKPFAAPKCNISTDTVYIPGVGMQWKPGSGCGK